MTAFSMDLLTLKAAYPSCQPKNLRLENVWRIQRVELLLVALTRSAMEIVDGIETYKWMWSDWLCASMTRAFWIGQPKPCRHEDDRTIVDL
jgi:hypothetical protein